MSQETTETPVAGKSAIEELAEWEKGRREAARRSGPVYNPDNSAPGLWFDQFFRKEITPSGTVECEKALRAGGTQNGLDVILVASHRNGAPVRIAAGATITLTTFTAEEPDGAFEATGPAICVTAPSGGISAETDMLVARFAIGNFRKPWLKIKLAFSGSITGGKVDAALGYAAR